MDLIVPLLPAGARPYAKAILAAVGIVVSVLSVTLTDVPWLPIVVQVLTALGVFAVPNTATNTATTTTEPDTY